jgi:hypothetical protein
LVLPQMDKGSGAIRQSGRNLPARPACMPGRRGMNTDPAKARLNTKNGPATSVAVLPHKLNLHAL